MQLISMGWPPARGAFGILMFSTIQTVIGCAARLVEGLRAAFGIFLLLYWLCSGAVSKMN